MKYFKRFLISLICIALLIPSVNRYNVYALAKTTLTLNRTSASSVGGGGYYFWGNTTLVDLGEIKSASCDLYTTTANDDKGTCIWTGAMFCVTNADGTILKHGQEFGGGSCGTSTIDCSSLTGLGYFKVRFYVAGKEGNSTYARAWSSHVTAYIDDSPKITSIVTNTGKQVFDSSGNLTHIKISTFY